MKKFYVITKIQHRNCKGKLLREVIIKKKIQDRGRNQIVSVNLMKD